MQAIYNEVGRIVPKGESGFLFEYTISDHLGNARVSFSDLDNNGSISINEILQENHYYPFGMNMEGKWLSTIGDENKYQYNGKELNDDLGLNWNDYGARWYDASIGRFTTVDPLAEKYSFQSPYAYATNNPVLLRDIMGMGVTDTYSADKDGNITHVDNKKYYDKDGNEVDKLVYSNGGKNIRYKRGKHKGEIKGHNIDVKKGILDKIGNIPSKGAKGGKATVVQFKSDVVEGKKVFSFLAEHTTNAEWSLVGIENGSKIPEMQVILSTSHNFGSSDFGSSLAQQAGRRIRFDYHSHPANPRDKYGYQLRPSVDKGSDMDHAKLLRSANPNADLRIFYNGDQIKF